MRHSLVNLASEICREVANLDLLSAPRELRSFHSVHKFQSSRSFQHSGKQNGFKLFCDGKIILKAVLCAPG